jgi:hypothetical protein
MIKNIVHYIGFLMLILFMSVSTVSAENSTKIESSTPEEGTVVIPSAESKLQLYMVLFKQTNICQATMVNLGRVFSVSLATMKNIDPNLPAIETLNTLLEITKQRYMQLTQMEQGIVQELKKHGVDDQTLGTLGPTQFNEAINYGVRVYNGAHASPTIVEGFIATLLQQNVVCEGGISDSLNRIKAMSGPPGSE